MCGLAYIALEQKSTEVTHYKNETEELGEQLAGVQGENTVLQEQAEKIERLSADISGLFEYDGNSFWNVNPLPVVGKEIEFSKRILNAYPADGAVREKLFFLYCIQSNFVEALKVSAEGFGPEAMRLRKLILHYPDYQYDGKTRPHGEKLMRFLKEREVEEYVQSGKSSRKVMIAMVHYDWNAKFYKKQYNEVTAALLRLCYVGNDEVAVNYDKVGKELTVHYKGDANYILGGAERAMYNKFHLDSLVIKTDSSAFYTSFLEGASTGSLDLSSCAKVKFSRIITVQGLRRLIVREGRPDDSQVRKYIRGDGAYEIVWSTEGEE